MIEIKCNDVWYMSDYINGKKTLLTDLSYID